MKRLLSAFVFLLGIHAYALAQSFPVPSLWQNQRGSTLQVNWVDPFSGFMQGTFINRAAGFQCRYTPYPALGDARVPTIGFTVNFTQCNTVTVWTGQVNGNIMPTTWVLTYPGGILRGRDLFRRIR